MPSEMKCSFRRISSSSVRRGSVLVLMMLMLPVIVILAALAINLSYMQLNRTEMYIASDAAARAGGREFTLTGDQAAGRRKARDAASRNLVNGRAPQLTDRNMVFGQSTRDSLSERYSFSPGGANPNALQVTLDYRSGSVNGALPQLMNSILPGASLGAVQTARSTQLEVDLVLVIDRSGSMAYAVNETADPNNIPRNAPNPYRYEMRLTPVSVARTNPETGAVVQSIENRLLPFPIPWAFCDPIVFPSRWLDLVAAVAVFLTSLSASPTAESASLVTYSSDAAVDCGLTTNYSSIRSALGSRTSQFCGGATNTADGIRAGQSALSSGNSRPWASKVMILMTDGIATAGGDAQAAAKAAADQGIMIFTVTFSDEADRSSMQRIAQIGNGTHHHAATAGTLQKAFVDIARQIPVVLTQ